MKSDKLTLTDLLAKGKRAEVVSVQVNTMEGKFEDLSTKLSDINLASKPRQSLRPRTRTQAFIPAHPLGLQPSNKKCYNCGLDFPHRQGPCPARGKTCALCKNKHHFARCCRSSMPEMNNQEKGKKHVSKITVQPVLDESCSSSDSDSYVYSVNNYQNEADVDAKPPANVNQIAPNVRLELNINNVKTPVLIDTGTSINLIDLKSWQRIKSSKFNDSLKLTKAHVKIFGYGSTQPIELLGKFEGLLEAKHKMTVATIHVIQGNGGNLLSFKTAQVLGLVEVKINSVEIATAQSEQDQEFSQQESNSKSDQKHSPTNIKPDSPQYVDHLVDHYRDLYVGVGKLRDCKVKLYVDETVEPVAQSQRRIPFYIRKKVEAELDCLEEEDIIEKVTDPTTWVSPLVFAPKKNTDKIRICVDLRQPNTAIKRTQQPLMN